MENNQQNINSISECLAQVINLTKKNLAILKAVNEAFYTKKNHLAVIVDDETYVIPSFISLESRIEALENNLENLVDAPLTGEAFTYFNGTTQKMELSGFHTAPNHVDISPVPNFDVETNNIFKDFMTPNPFVKIDIASIPNNIKHVVVRKIAITEGNTTLRDALHDITTYDEGATSGVIDFADVERILYGFEEGVDYTVYDTVRRLPIRKGVAQGEYEIMDIIDNWQDANFDEYYELELGQDLVYWVNNGTIQRDINIGDTLVTYNDKVMLEITSLNAIRRTITMKVTQGAYADLQDKTSGNPNLYKLKYFKDASDMDNTKYINIPLEEDEYVVVFVAPVNDTTNTRSPWGKGIFFDTDYLTMDINGIPTNFRDYYNKYVNNVGDALAGITSMMDDDQQITHLSHLQFVDATTYKPEISKNHIEVTQINKHLDNTKSIKTIRKLYEQKSKHKIDLDNVQGQIDQVNKALNELSFDDTTNTRTVYETQLKNLEQQRSTLVDSINKDMQEISSNASNSETPIENAKYRIRGFITIPTDLLQNMGVDVIKIDVEYRYKNKSNFTGTAKTYGEDYIFSDWNKMSSIYRKKMVSYDPGTNRYIYEWEPSLEDTNNPSFNQIDIPITQGEIVDIRVRYIYNVGYPFVELRSDWSAIYTQEFPIEYTKNVEILDIIAENNDEIKTRAFENILDQKGVTNHINDEIQDQTIKFMHKAEHISSGFLTEERRIIPLDTKLQDFNFDIENLKSEVFGAASTNLFVTLGDDHGAIQLKPDIINKFHTFGFNDAIEKSMFIDFSSANDPQDRYRVALSPLTLTFYNNGSYDMRLHTLFPGSPTNTLNPADTTLFDITDFVNPNNNVYMLLDAPLNNSLAYAQTYNQFIYFRQVLHDVQGTPNLYDENIDTTNLMTVDDILTPSGVPSHKLSGKDINVLESITNSSLIQEMIDDSSVNQNSRFACLYPYIGDKMGLCVPSGETYIVLSPGESISIPINFAYWFDGNQNTQTAASKVKTVTRMMAFDIRTSLFQNPITYKFTVDASYVNTKSFELRKNIIEGIQPSKLQRLTPATPKTIAKNTTDRLRAYQVSLPNQVIKKR